MSLMNLKQKYPFSLNPKTVFPRDTYEHQELFAETDQQEIQN